MWIQAKARAHMHEQDSSNYCHRDTGVSKFDTVAPQEWFLTWN